MAKKSKNYENHLFLDAFRKKNALLQQDVADFLGTSRGYISMVEKGDSKLSASKIEMLLNGAQEHNWDTSDLVPAYNRLLFAIFSDQDGSHLHAYTEQELDTILSNLLTSSTISKIKYGEIGINDAIADAIVKHYPHINRQWLIDGSGEMFIDAHDEPSELDKLREEVRLLRVSLEEYRKENRKLLEALPSLVAAEIARGVSNK